MSENFEYKVIGWTTYVDRRFPDYDKSKEAFDAIVQNVRENGFIFGGDMHAYYIPVLNDGTAAKFSWRGWGAVMAEAWQPDNPDPLKYYLYEMNMHIKPEAIKYPKVGVDFSLIERRTVHKLPFGDDDFLKNHYSCEKSLFVDVNKEEYKNIRRGDFIDFFGADGKSLMGEAFVVQVFTSSTVEKLVELMEETVPEWKDLSEELGFERELQKDEITELLRKKISPADEKKFGLWGIEVVYP